MRTVSELMSISTIEFVDMESAANYQEIDGGVKVLRQKDETKNKMKRRLRKLR